MWLPASLLHTHPAPLAWSNINGRLEGVLGSETVFLSVASSSLESGSAAFSFLSSPLMELQCLTALWMRCQAEPEPLHLRFTRRAQSRSKHSPAVHTEVETKAVAAGNRAGKNPPAAWLAAQPVRVLCFWTPTGAQSQALNMSALNSPGQKGDAGFIHLSEGELSLSSCCLGVRVPLGTSVCWLCWTRLQNNPDCSES